MDHRPGEREDETDDYGGDIGEEDVEALALSARRIR